LGFFIDPFHDSYLGNFLFIILLIDAEKIDPLICQILRDG
jgi:hypothetical protein